ncbi:hypothetical protein V1477_004229 [Vespula maculifrons]|uniref:Uncharacterized protein n=1 Tax=Vespula maculifrons TaxID=7453 RepID=A0ABD2CQZ6_VESMC
MKESSSTVTVAVYLEKFPSYPVLDLTFLQSITRSLLKFSRMSRLLSGMEIEIFTILLYKMISLRLTNNFLLKNNKSKKNKKEQLISSRFEELL